MTCPRDTDLSAYVDHMMKPPERARFNGHLQACPICQQRLDDMTALGTSLRALPSPQLGFDLAAQWNDRLHTRPLGRRPARAGAGWRGWMPVGLAGLTTGLALVSGLWLGGLMLGGAAASVSGGALVRVFDPIPPGGLCAAAEICRLPKGMP